MCSLLWWNTLKLLTESSNWDALGWPKIKQLTQQFMISLKVLGSTMCNIYLVFNKKKALILILEMSTKSSISVFMLKSSINTSNKHIPWMTFITWTAVICKSRIDLIWWHLPAQQKQEEPQTMRENRLSGRCGHSDGRGSSSQTERFIEWAKLWVVKLS